MNAYPIASDIKNPRSEGAHLIKPVGERVTPEFDVKKSKDLDLQGMGTNKRYKEEDNSLKFELD